MNGRRFFYGFLCGGGVLFALWLVGFAFFVAQVMSYAQMPLESELRSADAIVVLTGGSERVQEGFQLLQTGKGKKLLISGVHPSVSAEKILAHSGIPKEVQECCVVLGRTADNTAGNAVEARAFMQAEGFHSFRLVTAHYHMPRSLLLFRRTMPAADIIVHPVSPDIVSLSDWWLRSGTSRLLIGEYDKYLYALVGTSLGVL